MSMRTAKFERHTACENCGSSDAKAIYSNGGTHCFSCKKTTRGTMSGFVVEREQTPFEKQVQVPDDICNEFPQEVITWIDQYGLTIQDLIHNRVKWSPSRKQLLYIFQHMDKTGIGCIQGRNFAPNRPKYFNVGDTHNVLPIYQFSTTPSKHLVLVEDVISAIRISKCGYVDAMPLLGCSIQLRRLALLLKRGYTTVGIWLDHDKYREALLLSKQIQYSGPDSFVICTDLDPKCYTDDVINQHLEPFWEKV